MADNSALALSLLALGKASQGGGGTTYTAGEGIAINSDNEIGVLVDGETIQFNEDGELTAVGGSSYYGGTDVIIDDDGFIHTIYGGGRSNPVTRIIRGASFFPVEIDGSNVSYSGADCQSEPPFTMDGSYRVNCQLISDDNTYEFGIEGQPDEEELENNVLRFGVGDDYINSIQFSNYDSELNKIDITVEFYESEIASTINEIFVSDFRYIGEPVILPIESQYMPIDNDTITINEDGQMVATGGGSEVSGTNDGTNWTSLTIDDDTYAIPSGGSAPDNMMTTNTEQVVTGDKNFNSCNINLSSASAIKNYNHDTLLSTDSNHTTIVGNTDEDTLICSETQPRWRAPLSVNTKVLATTDDFSGTNDGTNWTSLTINGTTKAIPSGGGTPDNMVTTNTAQSITGRKTFNAVDITYSEPVTFKGYSQNSTAIMNTGMGNNMEFRIQNSVDGASQIFRIESNKVGSEIESSLWAGSIFDIGKSNAKCRNGYFSGNVIANNIPAPPSEDGEYDLHCSIVDGAITYSWTARE